jgi:molecular chaperone HtpG
MNDRAGEERFEFQAEVGRLLDIVARSLYSDKSVFLRELISNAADACDKLRYLALTEPGLIAGDADFRIRFSIDKAADADAADNGIGMTRQERSTPAPSRFLAAPPRKARRGGMRRPIDSSASAYAAFMVAERVEV